MFAAEPLQSRRRAAADVDSDVRSGVAFRTYTRGADRPVAAATRFLERRRAHDQPAKNVRYSGGVDEAVRRMSVSEMRSRLVRIARVRYAFSWVISVITSAVGVLFLSVLAYALIGTAAMLFDRFDLWLHPREFNLEESFGNAIAQVWPFVLGVVYVVLYLLPFTLLLPFIGPIVALWQTPPRFLLLRPFNRAVLSRPLKRLARREVAPFGHVYTLSDADIRVPWYIRIPVLLGQLALFSFHLRRIRDKAQIPRFVRAVDRTWLRNINWCMAFGKVFPVASSDEAWRELVECLLQRCDAVIIDVSDLRQNVMWEIDRAKSLRLETRTLYLLPSDQADKSQSALIQALGVEASASRLFLYTNKDLVDRNRFRAALVESAVGHATAERIRQRAHTPELVDIAATGAFAIGYLPLLAAGFPIILKLADWNPGEDLPDTIGRFVDTAASEIIAFGLVTWVLLIVASRRPNTVRFLLVIQTLLLLFATVLKPLVDRFTLMFDF